MPSWTPSAVRWWAWPLCFVVVPSLFAASAGGAEKTLISFERRQLNDQFWSEGATFGDLNNDGRQDLISGPWWWEGPTFEKRHEYYPATTTFQLKLGPQTSVSVPGFEGT